MIVFSNLFINNKGHPAPGYLSSGSLFLTLSNQCRSPERDSNLGPKRLSLLEFETWQLKPLSHHG